MRLDIDSKSTTDKMFSIAINDIGNTIIYFNEVDEAALYKVKIYRMEDINEFINGYFVQNLFDSNIIVSNDSRIMSNSYLKFSFYKNNLYFMSDFATNCTTKSGEYLTSVYATRKLSTYFLTEIVKPKNELYAILDFLSYGNYIIIVSCEDRNGNILKINYPFIFHTRKGNISTAINFLR